MSDGLIKFTVIGSSSSTYEVDFVKVADKVSVYCSCLAGSHGSYCKHRNRLLDGDKSGIASENPDELDAVLAWLSGSGLERAYEEFKTATSAKPQDKDRVLKAKRSISGFMR
jgi:hypothetical protein